MFTENEIVKIVQNNDIQKLEDIISQPHDHKLLIRSTYSTNSMGRSSYIQPLIPDQNLTLLHIAAIYDSLECYILLLKVEGLNTRTQSAAFYLPFHYACFNSSYEVAMFTLHIDPTIAMFEPGGTQYPYMYLTVVGGDPRILEALFHYKGNDKSIKVRDDVISKCISCRSVECLRILLEHSESKKDQFGDTSMPMKAIINNQPEALRLLVHSPADINFINQQGESVFSLACFYGMNFKGVILDMLRLMGNNTIEPPPNISCKGVCHWACQLGDLDVARAMFSKPGLLINRLDNQGNPGIFQLIDKYSNQAETQNAIDLMKLLIEKGFDINIRAPKANGVYKTESILEKFTTSIKPNVKIVEFLISNGADIKAYKKGQNRRLIDVIRQSRNKQMKEIFLNKEKDLEEQAKNQK